MYAACRLTRNDVTRNVNGMKVREALEFLTNVDGDVELAVWPQGDTPRPLRLVTAAYDGTNVANTRILATGESPSETETMILVAIPGRG